MRAGRVPRLRRDTHAEKKSSLRYILAMPEPIYLDHAATTPVRPEVREAMEPFFGPRFGNPSSMHRWGREARVALDEARERVANELATKAASLSRSGFEAEAARLRSIVRVLRVRALQEFRSGQRAGTIMDRIAKGFTDEEIQALAAWFAAQPK